MKAISNIFGNIHLIPESSGFLVSLIERPGLNPVSRHVKFYEYTSLRKLLTISFFLIHSPRLLILIGICLSIYKTSYTYISWSRSGSLPVVLYGFFRLFLGFGQEFSHIFLKSFLRDSSKNSFKNFPVFSMLPNFETNLFQLYKWLYHSLCGKLQKKYPGLFQIFSFLFLLKLPWSIFEISGKIFARTSYSSRSFIVDFSFNKFWNLDINFWSVLRQQLKPNWKYQRNIEEKP